MIVRKNLLNKGKIIITNKRRVTDISTAIRKTGTNIRKIDNT